tara:strand:+ start:35 stop:526 length:492 start_codon:yes stop_codon:yes gene_type:complete
MQSGKDIMFLKPQTPKPHLRLASEIDCIYLSENLRKEDIQEIQAVTGLPPLLSLLTGLKMSSVPLVICNADCKPVAMLGVVPNGLIGFIWMVGTDDLKKISLSFLRNSKDVCDVLKGKHQILHNYVDKRNKLHINWLKWMGFSIINEVNYGIENRKFYEFVKI